MVSWRRLGSRDVTRGRGVAVEVQSAESVGEQRRTLGGRRRRGRLDRHVWAVGAKHRVDRRPLETRRAAAAVLTARRWHQSLPFVLGGARSELAGLDVTPRLCCGARVGARARLGGAGAAGRGVRKIDAFVLVAAPEDALLDDREFAVPVVTPLELEIALGLREWGELYSTDFGDLKVLADDGSGDDGDGRGGDGAPTARRDAATADADAADGGAAAADPDDDDDAPVFSLVTGGYVARRPVVSRAAAAATRAAVRLEYDEGGGGADRQLALRAARPLALGGESPAAEYLRERAFQGLEPRVGETAPAAAADGRSGIASGYGGV